MRRLLLAVAAFALVGFSCPDSSSTTGTTSYVGTYTLISVGGHGLPAPSGDSSQTVTAGSLTLSSDGTFNYSETRNPGGAQGQPGTYTISGVNITFTPTQVAGQTTQGATGVFSNNGNTLTVTPSGEAVLVLTKN